MYPDNEYYYDDSVNAKYHCSEFVENDYFTECMSKLLSKISFRRLSILSHEEMYASCANSRLEKCRQVNGTENIMKRRITRTRPIKCDKFNLIYSLTKDESNLQKPYDECSRPFVVHKIPHSNLILLVTNRLCAQVFATEREFDNVPKTIEYINSTFCRRMKVPQLFRVRPSQCTNYHKDVSNLFPRKFLFYTQLLIYRNRDIIKHLKQTTLSVDVVTSWKYTTSS